MWDQDAQLVSPMSNLSLDTQNVCLSVNNPEDLGEEGGEEGGEAGNLDT